MCPTCNDSGLVPQPHHLNEVFACPDCSGGDPGPYDNYAYDIEMD